MPVTHLFDALRTTAGLVWPADCAGCGRPDVPLCANCRSAIAGPGFCTPVAGWPLGFGAWAGCGYRGVPARLIVAWKEHGRQDLTPDLAAGLGAALLGCRHAATGPAARLPWLVVPVPTTRAARRRRGGDLAAELATRAVAGLGPRWPGPDPAPVVVPALHHRRRVDDQGGLGVAGRRANLTGALAVRPRASDLVAGRSVVVVDDVVTTGTTAAEAATTLTRAGARVVGACFLSVTLRQLGVPEREGGTNLVQ